MTVGNIVRNRCAEKRTIWIVGALIGGLLLVLGIGGGIYFYQAPRIAFENLRVAASSGNLVSIAEYVDFDSLRASVKSYLIESAAGNIEPHPEASSPVAREITRLGKMVAGAALDPVVEVAVSPLGISAFLDGVAPSNISKVARSGATEQPIIETAFVNMHIFVVSIYRRDEAHWAMQLFFVRSGIFHWKLAAIRPL